MTFIQVVADVTASLLLLAGLFFMFVGAMGVLRLPDFYNRSHAAGKCVTLGVIGMVAAMVLFVASDFTAADTGGESPTFVVFTKAVLMVLFVLVAAPVGSHMLARAAHIARVPAWEETIDDELAPDREASDDENPIHRDPRS